MDSLISVNEKLTSIESDIVTLEDCLTIESDDCQRTVEDFQQYRDKLLQLASFVDKVAEWMSSVQPTNDVELNLRDGISLTAESYSNRLEEVRIDLVIKRTSLAERKKNLGNEEFKKGKFPAALVLYEQAIGFDPLNAIYYTNRALVYQKMDMWREALADAECAVSLDSEILKGHIILIKCQIKLELLLEVADSIDSAPVDTQQRPELLEQKGFAALAAKDIGNKFLKDGDVDDAIQYYSLAIRLDGQNHVFYSNRCASYQLKKQWASAVADAEKVNYREIYYIQILVDRNEIGIFYRLFDVQIGIQSGRCSQVVNFTD